MDKSLIRSKGSIIPLGAGDRKRAPPARDNNRVRLEERGTLDEAGEVDSERGLLGLPSKMVRISCGRRSYMSQAPSSIRYRPAHRPTRETS
jgi:hypothetical protein